MSVSETRVGYDHIDDVRPLGEDDLECLQGLRDVLQKHGKVGRFGVHLLHKHFDLSEDEAFLEEINVSERTLTRRAVKVSEIELAPGEGLMSTSIDLLEPPTIEVLSRYEKGDLCRYTSLGPSDPHSHIIVSD